MKLWVKIKQSLSGFLGMAVLAATPLLAEERMNFAFGFPATSAVGLAVEDYITAAAERSDGEIVITGFPMTLLSIPETNAGVRDRLADIGFVLTPYHPAEYSTNLFLHELNTLINLRDNPTGKEPLAFAGAMLEYTFKMCPECMEEFSAQNQVYTGGGVTPLYNLLCNDVSITSIEDVAGLRLRAGGAGFVRFANHFRAQGVTLPLNEVYEALDQGIIECAMLSAPGRNVRDLNVQWNALVCASNHIQGSVSPISVYLSNQKPLPIGLES